MVALIVPVLAGENSQESAGTTDPYESLYIDSSADSSQALTGNIGLDQAASGVSSWHIETLDRIGPYDYQQGYTSLALDGAGNPHISYYEGKYFVKGGNLRYAMWC